MSQPQTIYLQFNWAHIIEACRQQDPRAQEQLYKHCYPSMMKVCMRYCNGQQDQAAAAYNQAMLKVFRNIDQYKGDGAPEAWLRRIMVNTCIDQQRSFLRFKPVEINEKTADLIPVVPDTYNRISGQDIMNLVHELPKNTGMVFNLFVMEGYKHEEIGKILGISGGTSKWHLNEARKLLREKIDKLFKKEFLANAI
jgi:RNA polymerase sigma-70 factor (ECF subfamily)